MFRIDPFTGDEFIPKRLNQKFSSRSNQVKYNNCLAKKKRNFKSRYLLIIDNNYNLLSEILKKEDSVCCSLEHLTGAGFDFNYHTHQARISGQLYAMIYNCGISRLENGAFNLIKL